MADTIVMRCEVNDPGSYIAVLETLRWTAKRPVLVIVDEAQTLDGFESEPVTPDETLALTLDDQAAEAAKHGGMAATVSVLRQAARLSESEEARARRLAAAAHAAWKTGDPGLATKLLDTMTATVSEPVARPWLGRLRGLVELYSGDQAAALENLARAASTMVDQDQAARLLFLAIDAAHHLDRPEDVEALARRIGTLECEPGYHRLAEWLLKAVAGKQVPDPWQVLDAVPETLTEHHAHRWLVSMAISRRGPFPEAAREFGLVAADRLRTNGILALYTVLLPWLAELELRLGRWDDAKAHAEEALHAADDTGQRTTSLDAHACLARLAALTGDAEECLRHADFVLRHAPGLHNVAAEAEAKWALGSLHLSRGEHDLAAEHLSALGHREIAAAARTDLAEALGHTADLGTVDSRTWPYERARGQLRYGQWLRRERRITEAKVQLRSALQAFESLGAAEWAKRAASELRAAGSPARTGPAHVLTAQELQVAELAASGLSNREIGARLFLSPRTVGYHLYKLFPKLGIASRSQLRDVALTSA